MSKSMRTPILITGCQRSGTTLMNLILDSHPKIWGIDEDRFDFASIYGYLSVPMQAPFVSFKLPRFAHILPFIEMLPGCRVLWCIRDPLDTVASMVKLNLNVGNLTASWSVHPAGAWSEINTSYWVLNNAQKVELQAHMQEFGKLSEKFSNRLKAKEGLADVDRRDCVYMAALCWRIKNELPSLYKDRNIDFHVVRYADLVSNPKERIAEILDFIGIEWSDEVLKHHLLHKGTSIGNTSNTRAIDQSGVGSGKKYLSQEEQDLVKTICEKTATSWNYNFD